MLGDGDAEDAYAALVTRIHKAGITISTVATGGGTYGFGADYGTMQNIARWGGGNLCIADVGNQRVREVTTSGTMSTVAVPRQACRSVAVLRVHGAPRRSRSSAATC